VTKQLPNFLETTLTKLGEKELKKYNKTIKEFMSKKNKKEEQDSESKSSKIKSKKVAINLIPGEVYFKRSKFSEIKVFRKSSFSKMMTLNTESILNQIENFDYLKNTESEYYYQSNENETEFEDRITILEKKILDLEIILDQNQKYKQMMDKKQSSESKKSKTRDTLKYIKFIIDNKRKYSISCHKLLKKLIEIILKRSERILKKDLKKLQREENISLSNEQLNKWFSEFFYSHINNVWFKKDSFVDDKTFRMTCEVFEFFRIKDLIPIENSEKIEKHLEGSIELLKELDYTFSLDSKFAIIHKVLENISFLIHYTNDTSLLPGNEVILNVFIWCVIKAKNSTLKSTLRYLELFISDKEKIGELGFAMTQLEATILYIGKEIKKSNLKIS
jgi:hypothetical protein